MKTRGLPIDWKLPHVNPKDKKNLIFAEMPEGDVLHAKLVEKPAPLTQLYEFILPAELKAGETLTITLSTSQAQLAIQRRKPLHLFIDARGKNEFKEQETFHIDIRGSTLHNIRILAPSLVAKNKRFDVLVRFEDEFGNLTSYAPEGSLIELSYENQRENLNWKLFIPETGFINLPNLYFNEVGVYKIQLLNLQTKKKYFSAPIKCIVEADKLIYWGLLHGESEKNDSQENIEACLRQLRDEEALQFFGSSSFESTEETSNDAWKLISTQVAELNEDERFSTFLGFQYKADEGLRQIVYFKDQKPLMRSKDTKSNMLSKVYKLLNPKEALAIPLMTMGKGVETNFSSHDPELERVIEIYNAWGSSECSEKEGNTRPIGNPSKKGIQETEAGSVLKALKNNFRFGFVAGGLDDRGVFDNLFEENQQQYSPGLTAILAPEHTREALGIALQQRSCYATTGARIVVDLRIAGLGMGSELSTKIKPGLAFNRHITGHVAGTAPLQEVQLLRNGIIFKKFEPKDFFLDFTLDDTENLSQCLLSGGDGKPPFIFYYLRIIQKDDHMAWSSPIWIDYPEFQGALPKKKK